MLKDSPQDTQMRKKIWVTKMGKFLDGKCLEDHRYQTLKVHNIMFNQALGQVVLQ